MSQLDVLGPGFGMPSTAFDAFVGSGNKCRKVDVILAGVVAPRAINRKIADKLFCSESTVAKWRKHIKPGVGVFVRTSDGSTFSVRAK